MIRSSAVALAASVLLLAAAANAASAHPLAGRQLRQLMQQGSKYDECNKVLDFRLISRAELLVPIICGLKAWLMRWL
jgi:hypothetical protein